MITRPDSGHIPPHPPLPRRSQRFAVSAEVKLRRPGHGNFRARVFDLSCHGCRLEFIERPRLDDRAWIKFEGLEALEASVCWVDGFIAGVEFERPIHQAVFDLLIKRLG